MSEIPDDIMQAARDALIKTSGLDHYTRVMEVARAILAERERCAKVAEAHSRHFAGIAHACADDQRKQEATLMCGTAELLALAIMGQT